MEKYLKIPTSDWFEINWVLNWKEESEKLIIFVHGLTWYGWEAHYVCWKDYFTEKWFDVLRFDFYGGWEKNRTLQESTMEDIRKFEKNNFLGSSFWLPVSRKKVYSRWWETYIYIMRWKIYGSFFSNVWRKKTKPFWVLK